MQSGIFSDQCSLEKHAQQSKAKLGTSTSAAHNAAPAAFPKARKKLATGTMLNSNTTCTVASGQAAAINLPYACRSDHEFAAHA